jgi:methylase of polypeptide subunit release factors
MHVHWFPGPRLKSFAEKLLLLKPAPAHVVDVGSGSGVIALTSQQVGRNRPWKR